MAHQLNNVDDVSNQSDEQASPEVKHIAKHVSAVRSWTLLHDIAMGKLPSKLVKNLAKTIDANTQADGSGVTPVYIACKHDKADALLSLLEAGADINIADDNGHMPLHAACSHGSLEAIKALHDHGANLGDKNMHSQTCLELAAAAALEEKISQETLIALSDFIADHS